MKELHIYILWPNYGIHIFRSTCEELDYGEGSEDDPVGQPLGVVSLTAGLQGLDGTVGRVREPKMKKI